MPLGRNQDFYHLSAKMLKTSRSVTCQKCDFCDLALIRGVLPRCCSFANAVLKRPAGCISEDGGARKRYRSFPLRDQESPQRVRFRTRVAPVVIPQCLIDLLHRLCPFHLGVPLPEQNESLAAHTARCLDIFFTAFAKYLHFPTPKFLRRPQPHRNISVIGSGLDIPYPGFLESLWGTGCSHRRVTKTLQ